MQKDFMIQFAAHSGIYSLEAEQFIPTSIEKAWEFFSLPQNLAKITPKKMGFVITNSPDKVAHPGQIITYKIAIFPLIKSNWVTEITQVKDRSYFVDEQRFGPYAMWHHEHIFSETKGGVLMKDRIHFKLPMGFLGRIAYQLFVRRQLRQIFEHRFKTVENYFK